MLQPMLKKRLFQFSADQLPTLQKQLKQQEQKVRAAAPDPAHVKKLTDIVVKAQAGTVMKLCVTFKFMINFPW
jgi:hypothetical protein